jgi:TIR domain
MPPGVSLSASKQSGHDLRLPKPYCEMEGLKYLVDWWLHTHSGLVVLLGVGGAGKTALVAQFLRLLEKGCRVDPDLRLVAPEKGTFIHSFRKVASTQECRDRLRAELPEVPPTEPTEIFVEGGILSDPGLPADDSVIGRIKSSTGTRLIVLDGVDEILVPPVGDDTLWQIEDTVFNQLLAMVQRGDAPNVGILVTTRFPFALLDIGCDQDKSREAQPKIEVDRLDPRSSVHLLRGHGLVASNETLQQVAAAHDHHPLALAAAAERVLCDPVRDRGFDMLAASGPFPGQVAGEAGSSCEALVLLAEEYRALLEGSFPEAAALASHLCVFGGAATPTAARQFVARSSFSVGARFTGALARLRTLRLLAAPESTEALLIHPLLRFAFGVPAAPACRTMLADMLEDLLIATPDGVPPRDARRLDILEELLDQSLQHLDLTSAWAIYAGRMGGREHLAERLGDYLRGERVCRRLVAAAIRQNRAELAVSAAADWFGYLIALGRLADAETIGESLQLLSASARVPCSTIVRDHAHLLTLRGRLQEALVVLGGKERSSLPPDSREVAARALLRGRVLALLGRVRQASREFAACARAAQSCAQGYEYLRFLAQFERDREIHGAVRDLKLLFDHRYGPQNPQSMQCEMLALDLLDGGNLDEASLGYVDQWARERGAQELSCWARFARCRCALRQAFLSGDDPGNPRPRELLRGALKCATEGLDIARVCGYGIYFVDLLVCRARLWLLLGEPEAAESDALGALRYGIEADAAQRLPKLLPVCDPLCSYRLGEVGAREIFAMALRVKAMRVRLDPVEWTNLHEFQTNANILGSLYQQAEDELLACQRLRRAMRGPVPGEEALAREVERFVKAANARTLPSGAASRPEVPLQVLICYSRNDRDTVHCVVARLKERGITTYFDQHDIHPGDLWSETLDRWIKTADAAVVAVGPSGIGPWQRREILACIEQKVRRPLRILPILLPKARREEALDVTLIDNHYLDMSSGFTVANMDRLVRGLNPIASS